MSTTWHCLTTGCDARGTTEASAARHTRETQHGTLTITSKDPS